MSQFAAIVLAGLSIGVMVGLSVSPVVGEVISAMVAAVVGGVSLLAGIKHQKLGIDSVNIWPVCSLSVALLFGSVFGVQIRTSRILGQSPESILLKWTAPPFSLQHEVVAKKIFDFTYGVHEEKEQASHEPGNGMQPNLYTGPGNKTVCNDLIQANPNSYEETLQNAANKAETKEQKLYWSSFYKLLAPLLKDPNKNHDELQHTVQYIICPNK
jgi:hypothetical protein